MILILFDELLNSIFITSFLFLDGHHTACLQALIFCYCGYDSFAFCNCCDPSIAVNCCYVRTVAFPFYVFIYGVIGFDFCTKLSVLAYLDLNVIVLKFCCEFYGIYPCLCCSGFSLCRLIM